MRYKSAAFRLPELSLVAATLRSGLEHHYASVDVSVVDCPDLQALGAAARGMCGSTGLVETGRELVVRDFLQFYEHMGPGLLCFATLWTGDPTGGDLNLRLSGEHTHFCHVDDAAQQAGHYHGDITPEEVHYAGFFNLAERILRFGDIYEELGTSP